MRVFKKPRIFPGWWTVIAAGVVGLWGSGFQMYGFTALFKPVAAELGLNRASTSVATSIARFEGSFDAIIVGWITDRYGPRGIMLFGICLMFTGLMIMSHINSAWSLYLTWGLIIGMGHNFSCTISSNTAVSNWFVRKKGIALSTRFLITGFSGVLVLPLFAWLIETQGWRMACVIAGIIVAVFGIPLILLFIRPHRPEYYGLLPDGDSPEEQPVNNPSTDKGKDHIVGFQEVEFTLKQAMRTPTYWLVLLAQSANTMVLSMMTVHSMPLLTDMGIDPIKSASMMSIGLFCSLPARFLSGVLADRVMRSSLRLIVGAGTLMQASGIAVFLINQSVVSVYALFILYGVGQGVGFFMIFTMTGKYFGRKSYGSIQGSISLLGLPVSILAPVYFGWVYDTTGSYMNVFLILSIVPTIAGLLTWFMKPPKPPTRLTDTTGSM